MGVRDIVDQDRRQFPREFNDSLQTSCLILLYHGVTRHRGKGIENVQGKHIEESIFREQMAFVKNKCNLISLDEFIEINCSEEQFPPLSVVVSFDDGFKNNLDVACPILDEFQVPAIFYFTSGIIGTERMFWVDIIEDVINLCERKALRLLLDREITFDISSYQEKVAALREVKKYCKSVSVVRQREVIEDLLRETRVIPSVEHSDNYRKLSWNDVREIDRNPLFTVGGHSMHHSVLSQLEKSHLDSEISESLDLLSQNLGHAVTHYSYPEGGAEHYNQDVIDCLKKYGIKCCPSAEFGCNPVASDLFKLKRVMVGFEGLPFPFQN